MSPPQEHVTGEQWWTRYQPVAYTYNSRSGSESEFREMVARCNKKGIDVIVDAVINHMAAGSGESTQGTKFTSRNFPGTYSPNDFHHNDGDSSRNCEVDDYSDKDNVQLCDLVGLPDLATGDSYVQKTIADYIKQGQSWGVKGIRIDAAKHQDANELAGITNQLDGLYIVQEVISGNNEAVLPSDYFGIGQVTEFSYADQVDNAILNHNMQSLSTLGESTGLMPDEYALVFMDNHDTQRNGRAQLTYKNGDLYVLGNIYMLAYPYGNVRVMSSYYFTDDDAGPPSVGVENGKYCNDDSHWVCEHRWGPIANMVEWSNQAGTAGVSNWQTGNDDQFAFSRNSKSFIALNRGSSNWEVTLDTGLPSGEYCNVISWDEDADNGSKCKETVVVDNNGLASLNVPSINAVAFHMGAKK